MREKQSKKDAVTYAISAVARIDFLDNPDHRTKYESFGTLAAFKTRYDELKKQGVNVGVDEVVAHFCYRMNRYGVAKLLKEAENAPCSSCL